MMRITETVKQLIIINVIFFICSQLVGKPAYDLLSLHFPLNPQFKFWQPFTYMFMHDQFSFKHILFNMLGLWMFGTNLEDLWGAKKFLFFYISCGLGAALLHVGINYITFHQAIDVLLDNGYTKTEIFSYLNKGQYNPAWLELLTPNQFTGFAGAFVSPMLGASGALYGIFIAYGILFPEREMMLFLIPIPIKVKYFISVMVLSDLYLGFRGSSFFGGHSDGVAHFAHLGGALIGFIMMWYWKKNENNSRRWN